MTTVERSGKPERSLQPGDAAASAFRRKQVTRVLRLVPGAGIVLVGLVLVITIGTATPADTEAGADGIPALQPEPGSDVPGAGVAAPEDRPNASDADRLAEWARRVGAETAIPARVLEAYGRTEMWMRSEAPGCHLSWTTLAGIGRTASEHGTAGGAWIDTEGDLPSPILGPRLDSSAGGRTVPDTDEGELDGDSSWDRALGPMLLLPADWSAYRVRAARDGQTPDPQNIDDAALTTGRLLCDRGGDLREPEQWWQAVLAYDPSVEHAQSVFSGAEAYARASSG